MAVVAELGPSDVGDLDDATADLTKGLMPAPNRSIRTHCAPTHR
jgi:hypothetical protein